MSIGRRSTKAEMLLPLVAVVFRIEGLEASLDSWLAENCGSGTNSTLLGHYIEKSAKNT